MLLVSNQTKALLLASNSTGSVIKAKAVVIAKSAIPTPNIQVPKADPVANRIRPAIITKLDNLLETLTAGTIVERNFNQLYAVACCIARSEEHTSELQSRPHLVCRLLLEKK